MYITVNGLLIAYIVFAVLSAVLLISIIISLKLNRQIWRLLLIFALFILVPFVSNLAGFISENVVSTMIYAFVISLVFFIIISEHPALKVTFFNNLHFFLVICALYISLNFIIINNVFYLKAYHLSEQAKSITIRLADRIDPIIPQLKSDTKYLTFFGVLPNEYYWYVEDIFRKDGTPQDDFYPLSTPYINLHADGIWMSDVFVRTLNNLNGVNVTSYKGSEHNGIRNIVLESNMPVWPSEGSVGIINDVIVINFGISDVVFVNDEDGQYFLARHHLSEHDYIYNWNLYRNGELAESYEGNSNRLDVKIDNANDDYSVTVIVRNRDVKFSYPMASADAE